MNDDKVSFDIGFSNTEMEEMMEGLKKKHMEKIEIIEKKLRQFPANRQEDILQLYGSIDDDRFNEIVFETDEKEIASMTDDDFEEFLQSMLGERKVKIATKEELLAELQEKIERNEEEVYDDGECEPYNENRAIPLNGEFLDSFKPFFKTGDISGIFVLATPRYTLMEDIYVIGIHGGEDIIDDNDNFEVTKEVLEELYLLSNQS